MIKCETENTDVKYLRDVVEQMAETDLIVISFGEDESKYDE